MYNLKVGLVINDLRKNKELADEQRGHSLDVYMQLNNR
jgi:hypothetical protein